MSSKGAPAALPLDSYVDQSSAHLALLLQVNGLLVAKCMAAQGFTYSPPASSSSSSAPTPTVQDYGITSLSQARRYGYGPPGGGSRTSNVANSGSATPNGVPLVSQLIKQHGRAWVVALLGANYDGADPAGKPGCTDTATNELYSSAYRNVDRNIVGELANEASTRTQADSRVIAVESRWSRCMAGKGFQYGNPLQAGQQAWPRIPSSTEIATAVADVECKASTSLPPIWDAVEAGYQRQLIAKNQGALDAFERGYNRLIRMAAALVARR